MTATTDNTPEKVEETVDTSALLERMAELERRLGEASPSLPENAFRAPDGTYWHRIATMSEGGTPIEQERPLALTLEEAIATRKDFYHPTMGLIYEGYKLARDRDPKAIMADSSESLLSPEASKGLAAAMAGGN